MQVSLGPTSIDPSTHPLVVVGVEGLDADQPIGRQVKQSISQGADVVEVPAERFGTDGSPASVGSGSIVVAVADQETLSGLVLHGVVAVRWTGDPSEIDDVRHRVGDLPLVWTGAEVTASVLRPGDWLVVAWEERDRLGVRPEGVVGIIDLHERADRAELAALVTVGLERPVDGFRTVAPTAVRRAAHVIRAVERSR